ncbi:MAG: hypothetical protein M1837_001833 [Sclerophora amabilis]|nr:MAG: hypothetical protein M1837_001833 [Sclerophora amabilis]
MKFSSSLLLWTWISAVRCGPSASVFSFDATSPPEGDHAHSVHPEAATLILSRYLGVSHHYSLHGVEEGVLHQVNEFGRQQELLVEDSEDRSRVSKLLVLVDGVENAQDIVPSDHTASFQLSDALSPPESEELARTFSQQLSLDGKCSTELPFPGDSHGGAYSSADSSMTSNCCSGLSEPSSLEDDDIGVLEHVLSKSMTSWCHSSTTAILHISTLEKLAKQEGTSSAAYKTAAGRLARAFQSISTYAKSGEQSGIVILSPHSSRNAKRSPLYLKRDEEKEKSSSGTKEASSTKQASTSASSKSASTPTGSKPKPPSSSVPAKKGLYIPLCHSTLSDCNAATKNCSGHGSCFRKYSLSTSGDEGDKKDCYACDCSKPPSNEKRDDDDDDGDGGKHKSPRKTIQWGGAACQKKDVSAPFFLLAGFTIFMVGAVTWGVGLLYSIGQEELPGVIGAGVAGPRAQG